MTDIIKLPGLRAETLLGFTAALGTLRIVESFIPSVKLAWSACGGGWEAELHVPHGKLVNAHDAAEQVFMTLENLPEPHWILNWERFLAKNYSEESRFYEQSITSWLESTSPYQNELSSVFTSQIPAASFTDGNEHFDHPFRAARKDYYLGNLKSVINNTKLSHIERTLLHPWDYQDAMANQSLRLDHGDDRRHAYQWHAPTEDPARQKTGCMLGANRLAIESFPFFPCIPTNKGNTAAGFKCDSKTYTWITWPVWTTPLSSAVVASILNLSAIQEEKPPTDELLVMGIVAVFRSRRLPIEKNKVFLPPTFV